MRFEENSHCTFEERVGLVTKEIMDVYPGISKEKAEEIATLDEPINDVVNNDNKFIRYYYMLLVLHDNLEMKDIIYREMCQLRNLGLEDEKIYSIMSEVDRYMSNERIDFPLISEVYED